MWDVNDAFPATDSLEYVARAYSIDDACQLPIQVRVSERPSEERLVTVRRVTHDDWALDSPDGGPS